MDARPRTSPAPLFILTQSRSGKASTHKDVKNEGRSGDAYENKGQRDNMPEKKSDFVSDIARLPRNFEGFTPNYMEFVRGSRFRGAIWRGKLAATPGGNVLGESRERRGGSGTAPTNLCGGG